MSDVGNVPGALPLLACISARMACPDTAGYLRPHAIHCISNAPRKDDEQQGNEMGKGKKGTRHVVLWIGLAALVIAATVGWLFLPVKEWTESFHGWVEGLGVWGPVAFCLVYIVAVVALAPASALTIAGGLAFGFWALPLVLVAATIGAALAFLVSRFFLRKKVKSLVDARPKLKAIDKAVSEDGWKIVGLLRLSPLVPFNLQNYFFGVTQVGFLPYLAATAVGIAPGTLVYVYLGTLGKAAGSGQDGGTLKWVFFGVGLAATVAVAFFVTRKAQEKLREAGVGKESK